jgi:uncharacterized protein YjiS (DUF1127 family)
VIGTSQGEQAMSRDPAKRTAKAPLLQARPPCPGAIRQSATLGLLCRLLGWTYRPSDRPLLDNLSDHMLRDIGFEPDGQEDRFSRRR